MKKLCFLLALLLILCLCGCESDLGLDDRDDDHDSTEPTVNLTAEETLEEALLAFTGGDCGGYAVILGADGQPAVPQNTGIALLLSSHVTYKVLDLSVSGDRATAKVDISAPDAPQLLQQACAQLETVEEDTLYTLVEALLQKDPAMVSCTVEVVLSKTEGGWCVVVDSELSNALTGGLTQAYIQLQQELLTQLREGGAQ